MQTESKGNEVPSSAHIQKGGYYTILIKMPDPADKQRETINSGKHRKRVKKGTFKVRTWKKLILLESHSAESCGARKVAMMSKPREIKR